MECSAESLVQSKVGLQATLNIFTTYCSGTETLLSSLLYVMYLNSKNSKKLL